MSDSVTALLDSDQTSSPAESASPKVAVGSSNVPVCEKCQTPFQGKQEWCRRCGWYPRLRTHVELDAWDREDVPQEKTPSTLEVWRRLIPVWAWKLIAGVVVIVAMSFAARMLLPTHGPYRFIWTVSQIVIGIGVAFAGHISAFLFAIMENDRIGILDIVLKPFEIWMTVFRDLPNTFWRVALGAWGETLCLSAAIVGGLADKDLMDWGGQPARTNLMHAITDQAQELAGDNQDGLENAIEDFAGKAAVKAKDKNADKPTKPKLTVDCLIIGFEPSGNDDFRSLILASDVGGKLAFVGTMNPTMPKEQRIDLNKRMRKIEQSTPFVPSRITGIWLRPMLVCRVTANSWSPSKKLVQPEFEQMLDDIPQDK